MPSTQVTCSKCKIPKSPDDFYKGQSSGWCILCYRDWYIARAGGLVQKQCEYCTADFECTADSGRRRRFCSKRCKSDARRAKERADRVASKSAARQCVYCGQDMPPSMRSDAKFCSEECNSAAHTVTRKMAKRAARWGNGPYPDGLVSRVEIAERDGYRCKLCGGRVDISRDHPHPLAPSIDHKVPLARGGGNELDNLQLTHLRCNLIKGDR